MSLNPRDADGLASQDLEGNIHGTVDTRGVFCLRRARLLVGKAGLVESGQRQTAYLCGPGFSP